MSSSTLAEMLSQPWAMEPRRLEAFIAEVCAAEELSAGVTMVPTADSIGDKPALNVRDGVAHVAIDGPMLKRVSPMLRAFGIRATSTLDVARDIDAALADDAVQSIMLDVDSPGGIVSGVSELADKISAANQIKPVRAHASDMMASAAMWVASQARDVSANKSSTVGSIGVYTVLVDDSAAAAKAGRKVTVVSSTPLKGAGVSGAPLTDDQIADTRRLVDGYSAMFNAAIEKGRRIDAKPVATGQIWLADEAKAKGLIDHVCTEAEAHRIAVENPTPRGALVAQTAEHLTCNQDVIGATPVEGSTNKNTEAVVAADQTESPQTGATEKNMSEKIEAGAGVPVATEDEIKALKIKAAEADALKAQMLAMQGDALLAKYADRIAPAAMPAMKKMVEACGSDLATAEKALADMPKIVRDERKSGDAVKAEEKIETPTEADKGLMRVVGAESPQRLRYLEALDEKVDHVRSDGKAVLKNGMIVTKEVLDRMIGFVAVLAICLVPAIAGATAASKATQTICKGTGNTRAYLMTASSTIYQGSMVMLDSAGTAVAAAAGASNNGVVGIAQETKTSASSGSYWIRVTDGVVCKLAGATLEQADVGGIVWATDSLTVDETTASNLPVAGLLVQYDSASVGWVLIDAGINSGRTNTITDPLTVTADITLENAEILDNGTNGTVYFKGAGATNNEDFGIDLETTANAVTFASTTGVVKVDFAAIGTTLQLANDQTIVSDTNEEIQFGDTEDTSLGFGTSNEVTVTSDTGVTRWNFENIGVKTTNPLFITKSMRFCGNGSNATTAWYLGPVSHYLADESTYNFGGAGCDGLDSATEGTADAPASDGAAPLYVFAMRCTAEAGGADDVNTFQMRSATADVTGMTCSVTNDGAANKTCTVILNAPVTIAAGATVAIKNTQATDDDMSAKDAECEVFYTFK